MCILLSLLLCLYIPYVKEKGIPSREKMDETKQGIVFVILAACLWGIGGFFSKMGVSSIGPWKAAFIRSLCFFPVVMTFVFSRDDFTISFDREALYSIMAGILVGTGILLSRISLFLYEVSLVKPIQRLSILVTILLSFVILGERLTLRKGLGIALALTSFFLLSPLALGSLTTGWELCYLVGLILSLGSSTVLLRLGIFKKDVNTARFFRCLFQTCFVFLGVVLLIGKSIFSIPENIGFLFPALNGFLGGGAFILFCRGIKTIDAGVAKSFMVLSTIISAALGIFLLGECLTLQKGVGIGLALVAVILLSTK